MTARQGLLGLFAVSITLLGALLGGHIAAAEPRAPLGPNPLRALLPRASDLPGFHQVLDGPLSLAGASTDDAPRGVVRQFTDAGTRGLLFELFSVPDGDNAAIQPSTVGEALLRAAMGSDRETANFSTAGSLGIGDDDLAAAWNDLLPISNRWNAVYADVFLRGQVLGIVMAVSALVEADPRALGAYAQIMDGRVARPDLVPAESDWTLQVEQTVAVRDALNRGGRETLSTVRLWFAPGVGWRAETDVSASDGVHASIFGSDGTTDWDYDPATNQYTLQPATPPSGDPRFAFLGGEFGPAGTNDLASALAAYGDGRESTVELEGTETVAGRTTQRIRRSPAVCSTQSSLSITPAGTSTTDSVTTCTGSVEYWLDIETGWVLRSAGDAIDGTFAVDTTAIVVDSPIDGGLFQFTPPPGSMQVQELPR